MIIEEFDVLQTLTELTIAALVELNESKLPSLILTTCFTQGKRVWDPIQLNPCRYRSKRGLGLNKRYSNIRKEG